MEIEITQPLIKQFNGKLTVSSRTIAKQIGKRHDNITRDIRNILDSSVLRNLKSDDKTNTNKSVEYFIEGKYKVGNQKRSYTEYHLTRKGFTLYMFNIKGYNEFKIAYIEEFDRMENEIRTGIGKLPVELINLTTELTSKINEYNKILDDLTQTSKKEASKPNVVTQIKLRVADQFIGEKDILARDFAKKLNNLLGTNLNQATLFEWLRDNNLTYVYPGVCNNMPHPTVEERGLIKSKESHISVDGVKELKITPKITPKGQLLFISRIMDNNQKNGIKQKSLGYKAKPRKKRKRKEV